MTHDEVEMIAHGIARLTDAVLAVAVILLVIDPTETRARDTAVDEVVRLWRDLQ